MSIDATYKLHDIRYDLDAVSRTGNAGKDYAKSIRGTQDEEAYQQVQMKVDITVQWAKATVQLKVVEANGVDGTISRHRYGDDTEIPFDGSISSAGTTLHSN